MKLHKVVAFLCTTVVFWQYPTVHCIDACTGNLAAVEASTQVICGSMKNRSYCGKWYTTDADVIYMWIYGDLRPGDQIQMMFQNCKLYIKPEMFLDFIFNSYKKLVLHKLHKSLFTFQYIQGVLFPTTFTCTVFSKLQNKENFN